MMKTLSWRILITFCTFVAGSGWLFAQPAPKADDLIGTWQLVSSKNLQTGAVTESKGTSWIQFTKSHWMVLVQAVGRKVITPEEFEKLSDEEKVKANYSRLWTEDNDQVFQARGGSYHLNGNELHHTATIAILTHIIGIDRILRITRFDKSTLVVRTEFPDAPDLKVELTYRRLD